ncbi:MAG TPA: insulinase family protein [Gemmatimonadaceae bacterium]|nr:insulinase family protein [Gemmatimonadaceae bacterium]
MIALSLLFQLASTTAASSATPATPAERFELANGLRVWVQEDHSRPIALVQVTYKAGSINEQSGQTGIAHFVEHMVYRATRNIRNEDVYGYIDRIGGRYTGGTWPEFTRYAETVPSWALESALRVTAERMCCALFDSTEFERERSNVVTEANGFSDTDPASVLRDAVMYASFEAHPYRLNSNTWARDNLVLTRDEAFAWYKAYYGPNNAVLVVAGDVGLEDVRRLVEKHFASIPRAPGRGEVRVVEPPQRVEKRVELTYPGVKQLIEMVYHAPAASHADYPVLAVLSRVLSHRLARALSGVVTKSGIVVADSASEYPFVFRISVTQDSAGDAERTLSTIQSEIGRLGRDGASADEIAAASGVSRPGTVAQASTQSATTPPRRSYLTRIADSLSDREPMPWEVSQELRARIAAAKSRVTSADIRDYASRWLRQSQRTVGILGPGKDDFVPTWSDGRPLVAERMEIPPLTTPPAKRMRPEPVPTRALEPLAPLPIPRARRVLANGIVVRVARVDGGRFAIHVRADSGARSDSGGHVDLRREGTSVREASSAARELARRVVDGGLTDLPLTMAVVGPSTPDALLEIGAAAFSRLRSGKAGENGTASTARALARDTASDAATQVDIVATLPGVPRNHPDRRALELLNYIVGVPSYGGRLGWALSKSGLTYYSAARTTFAASRGGIAFMTTCDTRNTPATLQAIREVVAGVGAAGVEEWELREAQAFTLGRTLLYGARDDSEPDVIAGALLDSEYSSGGLDLLDLPALSRAYQSVTADEINRVARKYYRPELLQIETIGAVPRHAEPQIFRDGTFRALFEP